MGIFKAYDIRGVVPDELNPEIAHRIGNAFARFLKARTLVVGRDMRTHSPALSGAVIEGIRDAGCDVLSIGLCSTPMAYYAIATQPCDGGLVVTASHNPGKYNGMKLCRQGARPVSGDTGIATIEKMCAQEAPPPAARRGSLRELDLLIRRACGRDAVDHVDQRADGRLLRSHHLDRAVATAGHVLGAHDAKSRGLKAEYDM